VNMEHIKRHYYESHRTINPTGIVPIGPSPNFAEPHGREELSKRGKMQSIKAAANERPANPNV